jgi:hypothetical protein
MEEHRLALAPEDVSALFTDFFTTNYANQTVGYVWSACWNEMRGPRSTGV